MTFFIIATAILTLAINVLITLILVTTLNPSTPNWDMDINKMDITYKGCHIIPNTPSLTWSDEVIIFLLFDINKVNVTVAEVNDNDNLIVQGGLAPLSEVSNIVQMPFGIALAQCEIINKFWTGTTKNGNYFAVGLNSEKSQIKLKSDGGFSIIQLTFTYCYTNEEIHGIYNFHTELINGSCYIKRKPNSLIMEHYSLWGMNKREAMHLGEYSI